MGCIPRIVSPSSTSGETFCRVAVLDDDPDAADAVAAVLNGNGLQATPFNTVAGLLTACGTAGFDAFVLDWMLQDSTALGLIRTLRAQRHFASVPVFVLSGSPPLCGLPSDVTLRRAVASYDLEFRIKPFSVLRLAREVLTAICSRSPRTR